MTARRRLVTAAAATAALTSLAACQKPAPLVTVVSGGSSVYSEAAAFCFEEGATLVDSTCSARASSIPQLEVRQGERIGIDVDKELVERGWQLELVDPADPQRTQSSSTIRDQYFPFTAPGIAPDGKLLLTVRTVGANDAPTGEWRFELVNRT